MRKARTGKERWVVRLMRDGEKDMAVAYMKKHGMIEAFAGAPESYSIAHKPEPVGVAKAEEYRYPDFKPVRDPLPEGVRYAVILRELGNELQKVITWEEDHDLPPERKRQARLWMTLREQSQALLRGRLIGQVFPVEPNPDPNQVGYRIWRR